MKSSIVQRSILFILMILVGTLVFFHLGRHGLFDWDEAIYADISRNVLKGDILALRWAGDSWFEKPPLYFWTTAIFYTIFGINEFSSRVLSASSGILLSFLAYVISRRLFQERVALFVLVTIPLNSFLLFHFRFGTTDIFSLLLNTCAVYFYWLSQEKKKNLLLVGVFLGAAAMVKGPVIFLSIFLFGIHSILTGQFTRFVKSKYLWYGFMIFLAITVPWHAYMWKKFGLSFYDTYVGYHVIKRIQEPIEGHYGNVFYYPKLIFGTFPLALTLFFLPFFRKSADFTNKRMELVFVGLWLVIGYYFIDKVETKLPWYILPVLVPLHILTAFILVAMINVWQTLGKPLVIVLLIASIGFAIDHPYHRWTHFDSVSQNRDCMLYYKNIDPELKFVSGYEDSLPTLFYYLETRQFSRISDASQAPKNSIVLARNYDPDDNVKVLYKNETCAVAVSGTQEDPRQKDND